MAKSELAANAACDTARIALKAAQMRFDIVDMISKAGSGHPGGSLSAADIVAALYFSGIMNLRPDGLDDPMRDRFILSKGHAAPVLYAALAHFGVIERSELATLRKLHSRLQGHPDSKKLPGVEVSTGSLGQGLSIACGLALGLRMNTGAGEGADGVSYGGAAGAAGAGASYVGAAGAADGSAIPTVFVLLGDGETQEGQVWEAAEFASHNGLSNLVAILDHNDLQIDGRVSDVMGIEPADKRWEAFGWKVFSADGHDIAAICEALVQAKSCAGGPAIIIAKTVKGKGVSFMEDQAGWHGKAPDVEQSAAALAELSSAIEAAETKAGCGR